MHICLMLRISWIQTQTCWLMTTENAGLLIQIFTELLSSLRCLLFRNFSWNAVKFWRSGFNSVSFIELLISVTHWVIDVFDQLVSFFLCTVCTYVLFDFSNFKVFSILPKIERNSLRILSISFKIPRLYFLVPT